MNTLSKEFTLGKFYQEDPENYKKLRAQWSKMVNSDYDVTLTMAHHILYLILIGKNWKKAVTLPTNKNKVANHYKPHIENVKERWNGTFTKQGIISSFEGTVTSEMYDNAGKTTDFDMSQDAYKELPFFVKDVVNNVDAE
jgi:heterodisulfide reductase subunit B